MYMWIQGRILDFREEGIVSRHEHSWGGGGGGGGASGNKLHEKQCTLDFSNGEGVATSSTPPLDPPLGSDYDKSVSFSVVEFATCQVNFSLGSHFRRLCK